MELSIDVFDQIVTALGGAAERATTDRAADQRRAARLNLAAEVEFVRYGVASAQPRKVKLLSLSRSGAAVLDWASIQAGEKIVLNLPKPDGGTVPIVCMVKNTRISGAEFRLGVEFLSRAEEKSAPFLRGVRGVIERAAHEGEVGVIDRIFYNGVDPSKGGRESRVEINVQALASTYAEGQAGPMHFVTVKDISPDGGVCVLQPEEMKRDQRFVLQIPRKNGEPLTVLCTVVDCRPMDDTGFRIGARFESKLIGPRAGREGQGLFSKLRRWFAA